MCCFGGILMPVYRLGEWEARRCSKYELTRSFMHRIFAVCRDSETSVD